MKEPVPAARFLYKTGLPDPCADPQQIVASSARSPITASLHSRASALDQSQGQKEFHLFRDHPRHLDSMAVRTRKRTFNLRWQTADTAHRARLGNTLHPHKR